MHLTSAIIAHFTECSEHICTNFWGLYKNWCWWGWDYLLAIAEKQPHPHEHQFLWSSKKKAEIPSSQEEKPMV